MSIYVYGAVLGHVSFQFWTWSHTWRSDELVIMIRIRTLKVDNRVLFHQRLNIDNRIFWFSFWFKTGPRLEEKSGLMIFFPPEYKKKPISKPVRTMFLEVLATSLRHHHSIKDKKSYGSPWICWDCPYDSYIQFSKLNRRVDRAEVLHYLTLMGFTHQRFPPIRIKHVDVLSTLRTNGYGDFYRNLGISGRDFVHNKPIQLFTCWIVIHWY